MENTVTSKHDQHASEQRISLIKERIAIIPLLHQIQKEHACIPEAEIKNIAAKAALTEMQVYELVSSLPAFSLKPTGKYKIQLSRNLGADSQTIQAVADKLTQNLESKFGETTPDGKFTLEWAEDLGWCDHAPVLKIGDTVYTDVKPDEIENILKTFSADPESAASNSLPEDNVQLPSLEGFESGKALEKFLSNKDQDLSNNELFQSLLQPAGGILVCNVDEEDACAFADRILLQHFLDIVLEGMTIAGILKKTTLGILYLPDYFINLMPDIESTLAKRKENKLLGQAVLGHKEINFEIKVIAGGGNHIGDEEDVLRAILNGQRFVPHRSELDPSIAIENAGKFVSIAEYFFNDNSPLQSNWISVAGDCDKPGVYELSKGMTIKQILDKAGAQEAQGVLLEGYSGKFVSANQFDLPFDLTDETIARSLVVLNDSRNLMDVALTVLDYYQSVSCGLCTPCREGLPLLIRSLKQMKNKKEHPQHAMSELISLAQTIQLASRCSHGRSSTSVFLSIVEKDQAPSPIYEKATADAFA